MDWIAVKVRGADGIFRVTNEEGRYTAYLWDFKAMYVERVGSEEVLKRAKECNRSSEHDVKSVGMAFSGIPKEIEFQETGQLNLKYYFGSIPFRFYWQVQEDANELGETLVMPLLIALRIAHDRERELLEVIRQKDEEIQDYRRQDVPLLNRFLETKSFHAKQRKRKTEWDALVDPGREESLPAVLFPEVTYDELIIPEEEDPSMATIPAVKPPSASKKKKFLKRIQSGKIGLKTAELKYGQDQEDTQTSQEDSPAELLPLDEPPVKIPATTSTIAAQSLSQAKSKRRLRDVL